MTSGARSKRPAGMIEHTQALALRLAVVAALLTFALAFYARSLDILRSDIPLQASNGRGFWFVSVVAVVAYGFVVQYASERGSDVVEQAHRAAGPRAASAAVLPAMAVFAALQFVAWDSRLVVVISAPLLAGAGVFTAVVVRHYLLAGDPLVFRGARLVHLTLTAGVAFLSLSLARGWMPGPVYTLIVVFAIAGLLLYQAYDGIRAFPVRRIAYALAGAAVVAEVALALSYWPPSGWYGGAILATVFGVLMLIVDAVLSRRISVDVVARYTGAGVAVCGLLAFLAR
ncbi:MAG: hypothetical protein M3439_03000 [Chloroflexota bacterium]|nr:hypothetical protein [Chloroflexota bacterium]